MCCTSKTDDKIHIFSATVRRIKERDPRIYEEAHKCPRIVCKLVRGQDLHPHVFVKAAIQPRQRKHRRITTSTLRSPNLLAKTTEKLASTTSNLQSGVGQTLTQGRGRSNLFHPRVSTRGGTDPCTQRPNATSGDGVLDGNCDGSRLKSSAFSQYLP